MSSPTKQYLLIFLLIFSLGGSNILFASTKDSAFIPNDSASIEKRKPDQATQDDVYSDDDFSYVTEEDDNNHEETFWDRLVDDLMRSLFDDIDDYDPNNSSTSSGVNWWMLFFIILGLALIIFFIVKATGAGGNTLFRGKSKQKEDVDATLHDVDIHAIDYDAQITSAKIVRDYRLAVRLWFLRSLKEMSDRKLINWKINKTNSDYYYELSGTKFQKDFGKVSNLYDYVWYGEFKIDELRYTEAERDLQVFYGNVKLAEEKK